MIEQEFLNRIENAQESIQWQELGFNKNKGTTNCLFCLSKNKGYLYDSYFKCFSSKCGEKGNKITIHQKLNNLTFYEALCDIENKGNVDIQAQEEFFQTRNNVLSDVLEVYNNELWQHQEALDYLYSRGFEEEFVLREQIGYAPHNKILRNYNLSSNTLRRHDLLRKHGEFFSNRLIFPVYNKNSFLVHLTGRYFPGEINEYKYLDSSAMPAIGSCKDYLLFEKHLSFYKANKKTLFLVEGVPDSYILKQSGCNVVGLLGLQKILKQGSKLQDFNEIIAVFDNDKFDLNHPYYPGQYKSWRVVLDQLIELQIYLGKSVVIKTVQIPEHLEINNKFVKDVNDLYLYFKKDKSKLKSTLKNWAVDIVENYINTYKGDIAAHKTALKLVASTGRGLSLLEEYIPNDWSPLKYALKVLVD